MDQRSMLQACHSKLDSFVLSFEFNHLKAMVLTGCLYPQNVSFRLCMVSLPLKSDVYGICFAAD